MAKKAEDPLVAEFKKLATANRLILGTSRTITLLKKGTIGKVYLSKNCPEKTSATVKNLCNIAGAECTTLDRANDELGIAAKKPFQISIIGITR